MFADHLFDNTFGGIHMQASMMQPYTVQVPQRPSVRRNRQRRIRRLITAVVLAVVFLLLAPRVVDMLSRSEAPAVISYRVAPGDTLWDIAEQHSGGRDVRRVIYAIKQANHMSSATVRPGQELIIPKVQ
ncbi:MAG TPA: LysM peptidoglycan-binding domain-containing protein [Symbiobacteriaceae bacterium]|nr:LysM peptidoglycan-binding domain-containing protein [Symbiobacteriaceae bacterium]